MTGAPRPTIRRQLRAALVLLLIVGGILGSAWGAYRMTVGRPRLDGVRHHDFGLGTLVDGRAEFDHTFVLTNTGSSTIEIGNIRTSCGCTVAEPSTRSLGPGERIEIAATLTLKTEGRKRSRIFLEYDGSDVDVLHMEGWARHATRLSLAPGPTRLIPGAVLGRLLSYRDYDTNDKPPPPSFSAPPGIRVAFFGWKQVTRLRSRDGMPARWRGQFNVRHEQGTLEAEADADAEVEISVGPDESVRMPLMIPAGAPVVSKPVPPGE
jgi:hypothetical protein